MDPIKLVMMFVVLIYGALLFIKPRLSTAILVFLCIVNFNWFTRYMGGSAYLSRLVYFVAMLLALKLCVDLATKKFRFSGSHNIILTILKFIFLLAALAIVSDAYNGESYLLGIYELRYFFLIAVLSLSLFYYKLLPTDIHSFTKLSVYLGLIQIPPALLQYFLAGGGMVRTLDSVSGTFGGYGPLVFLQVFAIGAALTYKQSTGRNVMRINTYLLCALFSIPVVFSNSRTAFGFILIMLAYVYLNSAANRKNLVLVLKNMTVMILLIVISAGFFYEFFWKARNVANQLNLEYVINYYFRDPVTSGQMYLRGADPVMGRGRSVAEATRLISDSVPTAIFGRGSGSTTEAAFLGARGGLYQEYGPLAGVSRTQYSKIIVEFGIAGVLLFLFFFARIKQFIQKINHPDQQLVTNIYKVFLVCAAMLCIYHETFASNLVSLLMAYLFTVFQFYTKEQGQAAG
jgi:hypothetical protein